MPKLVSSQALVFSYFGLWGHKPWHAVVGRSTTKVDSSNATKYKKSLVRTFISPYLLQTLSLQTNPF